MPIIGPRYFDRKHGYTPVVVDVAGEDTVGCAVVVLLVSSASAVLEIQFPDRVDFLVAAETPLVP